MAGCGIGYVGLSSPTYLTIKSVKFGPRGPTSESSQANSLHRTAMATRKASSRRHQKSEYPDRILNAAARIFAERPYASVSMDDIARAAKTTKSVIYYYFESKADLILLLSEQTLDESLAWLNEAFASDGTPLQRLRQVLWVHTKTVCDDHRKRSLDARTGDLRGLDVERVRVRAVQAKRLKYFSLIQRLFDEAAAAGFIRSDLDLVVVTRIALGGLNGIADWYRERGRLTAREIADIAVEYVLSGLVREDGPGQTEANSGA